MTNSKMIRYAAGIAAIILLVSVCILVVMSSPKQKYKRQLAIAREYLENGNYEQAIAEFEKAIEIYPNGVDA